MSDSAALRVGERVRCRPQDPDRHNRAPRYVQRHVGAVVEVCGSFALPDELVASRGAVRRMEPVYTVRFTASELWGAGDHAVTVDLWASYLEPETNP
jgi:Nitrile hydratase beta subunit